MALQTDLSFLINYGVRVHALIFGSLMPLVKDGKTTKSFKNHDNCIGICLLFSLHGEHYNQTGQAKHQSFFIRDNRRFAITQAMKNTRKRVMCIDDDVPILAGMRAFPWERYYCVYVGDASNGKDALFYLDAYKPDIVFIDIVMPLMNGLDFLKVAKPRMPSTKFIIYSAYCDFEYAREAIRLGASDYLAKGEMTDEELGKYLLKLIGKTGENAAPSNTRNNYRYEVQYVIDETKKRFMDGLSLDVLASELGVSPNHLGTMFQKETGKRFKTFLNDVRMERAYILLKNTPLKVYEVSEQVGFRNTQYFNTAFSKYYGFPPGQI